MIALPTALAALQSVEQLTGAPTESLEALQGIIRWTGVLVSVFVIAIAVFLLRVLGNVLRQLGEVFVQRRMLLNRLNALAQFSVWLATVVLVILLSLRLTEGLLAVLGGTAAVAVGFGVKDLAASIIAGITIMIDQPFQVGDRIHYGGYYGSVIAIGLRSVRLRTLDDSIVTIPNNVFQAGITSNSNSGSLEMQVVVDFYVGLDQDVRKARAIAREAVVTSRYVSLNREVIVLVKEVIADNYLALRVRVKAYVLDTRYEKSFETDVTLRVLDVFADNGIEAPAILHRSN